MDFIEVCDNAGLESTTFERVFWDVINEADLAERKLMVNNIVYEKLRVTRTDRYKSQKEAI